MDWEDRLDDWELELELNAQLEGSDWVTLERAAADTGVSRAALRSWYRSGQIPSRLAGGPHGPQRLVPLAMVASAGRGVAAAAPGPRNGGWRTRRNWRSSGTGSTSSNSGWPPSRAASPTTTTPLTPAAPPAPPAPPADPQPTPETPSYQF